MHFRRPGMVLLAAHRHPVIPAPDNPLDDADATPLRFERDPLFDMRFEIADIAGGIEALSRPSGKTGCGKRIDPPPTTNN